MLHPEARFLLDLMAQRGIPPTHTLAPAQARQMYVERRAVTQPEPPPVALAQDIAATGPGGTVPLRHYRPAGSEAGQVLPVLVYYHGGGWVIGDLDTHDVLCRQLANASGCAVIAVHYRLAPEAVFPAAVDDCLAATRWVHANATALCIDPARIAVGGDSAGGNLAAVVSLAVRDSAQKGAGDLAIRFQLLIYPAVDMRQLTPSITANGKGYMLEQDTMAYFQGHYTGQNAAVHDDWRASPLLASSHKDLPP
ncbi:MAG: alpha/beta hydrolase, partial [Rhodoferax sp.]